MRPGSYNLEDVGVGDTSTATRFTLTQTADEVTTPIDLTGATITAQFKSSSAPFSNFVKSNGKGITVVDALAGIFEIDPFVINMAGEYKYSIKFQFSNGFVKTYIKGKLIVYDETT